MCDTLNNIASLVQEHDWVDLFWWPYNEQLWIKTVDRTDEPVRCSLRHSRRDAWSTWLAMKLMAVAYAMLRRWPRLTPAICRAAFRGAPTGDRVVDRMDAIHYRRAIEAVPLRCMEMAFTIDPDFNNVRRAWSTAVETLEEFAQQGRYPLNMTMNARFTNGSSALLSPAGSPGHTCWIEMLSHQKTPGWEEFSRRIADEWLKLPGARFHWAKEWEHIPGAEEHIARSYGANLQRFLDLRDGFDPHHMFTNPLLDRIFTPAPASYNAGLSATNT